MSDPTDERPGPITGAALKVRREALGLSAHQFGQLLDPVFTESSTRSKNRSSGRRTNLWSCREPGRARMRRWLVGVACGRHTGFVVLPRRWVVERTLSWIARHRRWMRPRLRTTTRTPRNHGPLEHDPTHQQTPHSIVQEQALRLAHASRSQTLRESAC